MLHVSPAKVSAVISIRGDDGVFEVDGSLHSHAYCFLAIVPVRARKLRGMH